MDYFKRLALALLLTILASSTAWALTIDYSYVSTHDFNSLNQAAYDAIGQQTWMFTHASVGGNMLGGMDTLHSGDSNKYQLTTPTASSGAAPPTGGLTPGSIYDVNRGNPGWANKYTIFETMVKAGWGNSADFVMDKLCYIDQAADVSVYLAMMNELEGQYSATFVYTTMPLTTGSSSSNDLRNRYNEAVRTYAEANGKLLFDIADLEAHDEFGNEQTYLAGDGSVYQTLWSGWTDDGGHLNGDGRIMIAEAWYAVAASQATPIPGTALLLGFGIAGLTIVRRKFTTT